MRCLYKTFILASSLVPVSYTHLSIMLFIMYSLKVRLPYAEYAHPQCETILTTAVRVYKGRKYQKIKYRFLFILVINDYLINFL